MMKETGILQELINAKLTEDGSRVEIIDQTRLPNEVVKTELNDIEGCYDAIKMLRVRGSNCIGVFAALSMYVLAQQYKELPYGEFAERFHRQKEYLNSSRPTAVNLSWSLGRMESVVKDNSHLPSPEIVKLLGDECQRIQKEDIEMCNSIAEFGLSLLKDGDGILTHCNAGPLATSGFGTGIGPILLGNERGMNFRVFADETRPLLQGARLTAFELQRAGVDVTLICDNMASIVMKNGWIKACMVGCDRVAANGDAANKIGTSGVAILAKHYGIPFYVLGASSTIDMNCPDGEHIIIEERNPEEIKEKFFSKPMALEEVKCYNPAFDVTDHELITAIITEKGICYPPYDKGFRELFGE